MYVSVARILIFPWCIVTELSFWSKFWKDDDLSLYVILNAVSCIRFVLLLRPRLWNIQTNGQYPNCDSMKAFIIILFYQRSWKTNKSIRFLTCFFTEILTCSSDFKSLSIVIPRSISFVFDSMEEPSISAVDGSLQLKTMWLLSLLTLIKLLLNHVKSGSYDDASNLLITDCLFSLTMYLQVWKTCSC